MGRDGSYPLRGHCQRKFGGKVTAGSCFIIITSRGRCSRCRRSFGDQLILDTTTESFDRVLAPKVTGSMTLHEVFPVGTLDFMVLFSSCGQLFGFPGQGSYASGNAFLDTLALHRRDQGDNCRAFQWTSWRGMGMAASTDFIDAELDFRGITDISRDEAFIAW